MIKTNELRAELARNNMTGKEMASILHMTPKTFYDKMSKGVFGSDEIEVMINILHIEEPMHIFFAKE